MKKVAIIIPVHNRREKTISCLSQLKDIKDCGALLDIVVVDDASTDGTENAVRDLFPQVIILKGNGNLWWTGAINLGVKYALENEYDYVFLLNDDLVFENDFMSLIYEIAIENPNALISSIKIFKDSSGESKILTAGFKIEGWFKELSGIGVGKIYNPSELDDILQCNALTGASLLIPSQVFKNIGFLDYKRFPHNWGDLEFTRRANLHGYKCLVSTKSRVYTDLNRNYHLFYIFESTRSDYVKNLFNNDKFNYGFNRLCKRAYMHKSFFKGSVLFGKYLIRLMKWLSLKIILPNSLLATYVIKKEQKNRDMLT